MKKEELQKLTEDLSLQYFHKPFIHEAKFNARLRTTGGRYLLKSHDIELNEKYLEEHGIEELVGIIKHELCHYHLHIEGKGYKHRDRDFKEWITKIGAPRFCNPLPSENKKRKVKHVYECFTCKAIYYRKNQINTSKYVCGVCKGKLYEISPI
jgi:SprT-like protein